MPLGPAQEYLAQYNSYTLPGYVQTESFDSKMNIASHYGAYIDGSPSEETGLSNKELTLTLKVWEPTYLECKQAVELGATILRSFRGGFAPLYIQTSDRHYQAMVVDVKTNKEAGSSVRTLEYSVQFECKPWAIDNVTKTLTGTGTIDTDQVNRTIDDGGWTPTIVTVTGTDVVIAGYTATQQTGLIQIQGSVTGLVINTEAFTAIENSLNVNDKIINKDYRLFVGPGKTFFDISGASSCTIEYENRWYL